MKYLIISAIVWFVIVKLMRFKFVIYKGNTFSAPTNNAGRRQEGSISVEGKSAKQSNQRSKDGEYIDYEEVK